MSEHPDKPERLERKTVYENPWVNLYVDRVRFPGGRIIDEHHLLDFQKEGVAAIVENEKKEILFVEAYRYTTNTIEWEIPAGGLEKGEDLNMAAAREVLEETGYETADYKKLNSHFPLTGISNKIFHIVRCRAAKRAGDFDHNEIRSIKWLAVPEIKTMIRDNIIKDGLTLTSLLLHLQFNAE